MLISMHHDTCGQALAGCYLYFMYAWLSTRLVDVMCALPC
jgi:hypothetical protein